VQASHFFEAEPVQAANSEEQNSGSLGLESATHAEDGFAIADCRLPICEVPPTGAAHQHPNGGPKGLLPEKDGENEGTSGDVYENKGMETKCLVTNSASRTKMHQSHTC